MKAHDNSFATKMRMKRRRIWEERKASQESISSLYYSDWWADDLTLACQVPSERCIYWAPAPCSKYYRDTPSKASLWCFWRWNQAVWKTGRFSHILEGRSQKHRFLVVGSSTRLTALFQARKRLIENGKPVEKELWVHKKWRIRKYGVACWSVTQRRGRRLPAVIHTPRDMRSPSRPQSCDAASSSKYYLSWRTRPEWSGRSGPAPVWRPRHFPG